MTCETGAALGSLQPGARPAAHAAGVVRLPPDEVEIAGDALQEIVEVMRDATGQSADRLHLLRLPQAACDELELAGSFGHASARGSR